MVRDVQGISSLALKRGFEIGRNKLDTLEESGVRKPKSFESAFETALIAVSEELRTEFKTRLRTEMSTMARELKDCIREVEVKMTARLQSAQDQVAKLADELELANATVNALCRDCGGPQPEKINHNQGRDDTSNAVSFPNMSKKANMFQFGSTLLGTLPTATDLTGVPGSSHTAVPLPLSAEVAKTDLAVVGTDYLCERSRRDILRSISQPSLTRCIDASPVERHRGLRCITMAPESKSPGQANVMLQTARPPDTVTRGLSPQSARVWTEVSPMPPSLSRSRETVTQQEPAPSQQQQASPQQQLPFAHLSALVSPRILVPSSSVPRTRTQDRTRVAQGYATASARTPTSPTAALASQLRRQWR